MAAAAAGPAERSQAGLFIARATFHVTLHPARTLNVEDACRDELTSRLMRFDEELGGVLLAFWGDKVLSHTARILDFVPFLCVSFKARVLLFKPGLGSRLVGRVTMVGADHVTLKVLDAFQVTVAAAAVRPDLRFTDTAFGGEEFSRVASASDSRHEIRAGCEVAFRVAELKPTGPSNELLSLVGSLLEDDTGEVAYLREAGRLGAAAGAAGDAAGAAEEADARKRERRAARKAASRAAKAAARAAAAGRLPPAAEAEEEEPQTEPHAVAAPPPQMPPPGAAPQQRKRHRPSPHGGAADAAAPPPPQPHPPRPAVDAENARADAADSLARSLSKKARRRREGEHAEAPAPAPAPAPPPLALPDPSGPPRGGGKRARVEARAQAAATA